MEPLKWWPDSLGQPAANGSQGGMRYAFFPDKKLLLIERAGRLQQFDSGEHYIGSVAQVDRGKAFAFTSEAGPINLDDLKLLT
jgi:hypothetical protein